MNPSRRKVEVSQDRFEEFVRSYPAELTFDGLRYTEEVKSKHLIWHKPVAVQENGKFYLVEEGS